MPTQKITKEELIFKSIQIFRRKGYYRTSMSDLAKACGLTKGAFYHHFKSKEEVMLNCLETTSNWFESHIFAIAYGEGDAKKKLKKMSQVTFKAFTKESGGCYFANTILETAQVEDTFKETMKTFFSNWEAAMTHLYQTKHPKRAAKKLSIKSIVDIEGSIVLMQLYDDVKYLKDSLQRGVEAY